jgi:hypothetical protein
VTIDYLGTGLFFLWVSFSIFRWVVNTIAEVREAPPAISALEEQILRDAAARSGTRLREMELRSPGVRPSSKY